MLNTFISNAKTTQCDTYAQALKIVATNKSVICCDKAVPVFTFTCANTMQLIAAYDDELLELYTLS